jgi:hypothetical protein
MLAGLALIWSPTIHMNPETRSIFARLNARWLAGEKVDELRFLYNSVVEVTLLDGTTRPGCIVGATVDGPEPVYTLEAEDGDFESTESAIRIVEKIN